MNHVPGFDRRVRRLSIIFADMEDNPYFYQIFELCH
jgi:hypothetical protein